MRFKNYINRYNQQNRIYSEEDLLAMTLTDLLDNEPSIVAQDKEIGIPNYEELKNSPNTHWIDSYINQQGQKEGGYYGSIQPNNVYGFAPEKTTEPVEKLNSLRPIKNFESTPVLEGGIEENVYKLPDETKENILNNVNNKEQEKLLNNKFSSDVNNLIPQNTDADNIPEDSEYLLEGGISKSNLDKPNNIFRQNLNKARWAYKDLTPKEKGQKYLSKHMSWWTPTEYYGLAETLADEGKPHEKYTKNNDFTKLGAIEDSHTRELLAQKVERCRKACPVGPYTQTALEDVDVVIPKDDSEFTKSVLRSDELKEFVEKNYDRLKSGEVINSSIEFKRPNIENIADIYTKKDEIKRFTVLHNIDISDAKMESDGSITMKIVDYYDFTRLPQENYDIKNLYEQMKEQGLKQVTKKVINNAFNIANNRAYEQQKHGKLKPYVIYKKITYKL